MKSLDGHSVLCSPVLTPQIVGGAFPPGLVTENLSAMHWEAVEEAIPVLPTLPLLMVVTAVSMVEGPVMVKAMKSNRSCPGNRDGNYFMIFISWQAVLFSESTSL